MNDVSLDFNAATLQQLYPYIVPRSWVEYANPQQLIAFPFSDEVYMVLVVDGRGTVRNVRPEDLDTVRTSPEEAFEIAAGNLGKAWQGGQFEFGIAELLDGIKIGGARGNWMAPAGALILGNFYQMLAEHFRQDQFAAVAVNQECLFAFPTDERTLVSKSLRQAVEDEFLGHRKPISRSWLLLDGNWPSQYPSPASF